MRFNVTGNAVMLMSYSEGLCTDIVQSAVEELRTDGIVMVTAHIVKERVKKVM